MTARGGGLDGERHRRIGRGRIGQMTRIKIAKLTGSDFLPNADAVGLVSQYDRL